MKRANEIRQGFLDFFEKKKHSIAKSAPIVTKDDPSLMFTNAGMNQFKDFFLGHKIPGNRRIADTQKCLRVSGKHNDLEEVGRDSYHHTMFEMLGNWSIGDYFKKEAIAWAWELLTEVYGLPADRLYATCFSGDASDSLKSDSEAANFWKSFLQEDRILFFGKKDNFWEMGDTGPCGPCSEIHIDMRDDAQRTKFPAQDLINKDHPEVIELWNLVFIQFNRKANGVLEELPEKHVDTGMGFERLCMAIQNKISSYDTDLFSPFIKKIEKASGIKYTNSYAGNAFSDIAMRVMVDHLRAVCFTIADGELPSNTGAGYVIRRILRRAVRYYYSFLNIKEAFLHSLVGDLAMSFKDVFPELNAQQNFIEKVIYEEEKSFLNTLDLGLKRLSAIDMSDGIIDGNTAFELYDTYGFPIDLTRLIAAEKGFVVDDVGFQKALNLQKDRSRADAKKTKGDWIKLHKGNASHFAGYDSLHMDGLKVLSYRTVKIKGKDQYQLVLNESPFYPEGGGQVGDTGYLMFGDEKIDVLDTKKENDLIIHIIKNLPGHIEAVVAAHVDSKKRKLTENNHTATHLLHAALRKVVGTHVQQKGSLVQGDHLRFDFSHFQKLEQSELDEVERIVNQKIRENIQRKEDKKVPIEEAKKSGAMMLFGEKYGDTVRMITFDPEYSVELCGGCHVSATGQIGLFKIISESAIAAGVRRIEAVTADAAEAHINTQLKELEDIRLLFKNPTNTAKRVEDLQIVNKKLIKQLESLQLEKTSGLQDQLKSEFVHINGINFLASKLPVKDVKAAKSLAYNLEREKGDSFIVFGIENENAANLLLVISKDLTESKGLHAGEIIRTLSKQINGGGGGQAFFATAGGKNPSGLESALKMAKKVVENT